MEQAGVLSVDMMERRRRPRATFDTGQVVADMAVRGWNANALAARASLSPATVCYFLRGERQTAKTAGAIAKALGYSARRYFAGVERSVA